MSDTQVLTTSAVSSPASPLSAVRRRMPAEEGVWVFIGGDMMFFALFFNLYAYYRAQDLALFNASQATLDSRIGLINMMLLLTASWFIVKAMHAVHRHARQIAFRWTAAAMACGIGFCVLKLAEYAQKIQAGVTLLTNDFYMYYFVCTGLHFMHLLLGLGVLTYLLQLTRRAEWNEATLRHFEGGAAYWHMVDLLWIVMFPLIYLVR